jgi:hypothetical protein
MHHACADGQTYGHKQVEFVGGSCKHCYGLRQQNVTSLGDFARVLISICVCMYVFAKHHAHT